MEMDGYIVSMFSMIEYSFMRAVPLLMPGRAVPQTQPVFNTAKQTEVDRNL